MSLVLAIDFGTSGCRSAIYDDKLNMLDCSVEEYPLIVLSDNEIEQDANVWWDKAKKTIKEVVSRCKNPQSIKAVSIDSQGIGLVPVDKEGNTLYNCISWLDTRCTEETEDIETRFGRKKIYRYTGKRISSLYSLPKYIWFKNRMPEVYEKTWKFLLPMDYIQFKLSGKCVTDYTMAAGTMFYNVEKQAWDEEILGAYGLDKDKLPEIKWAGDVIGTILPEVAEETGLSRDAVIVNGAQDQKCAAYGAGASETSATISLGTGSVISRIADRPMTDPGMRIPFFSYLEPDTWDIEGVINTAGSAYSWFRKEFAENYDFDELNKLASGIELPNQTMFFPSLSGAGSPRWDNSTGTFTGMSLLTGKGHLARAVMEGIAYSIRENIEVVDSICGKTNELRLFGGGSKSSLWCQIIADVNNIEVICLLSSETALAGAARLAYKALNVKTEALPEAKRYAPNPENVEMYELCYERYKELNDRFFYN